MGQKKGKSEKIKLWMSILGAPVIVGVMLLIVYAVKGIYPFGDGNISYFDMAQSTIPAYYHTYDVLHGTKDLSWSWYSCGGVSLIDIAGNYILNPFNLFFLFVKRNMILEFMSFFLLLKVCVSAGIMSFYFRKTFRNTEWYWHVFVGVLYASCGYVIQYYTNIQFLDLLALFPLIMYFTDKLLKEGKVLGFCITMSLGLVISVYYMYMVCVYLVVYSVGHIRNIPEEKRRPRVLLLGLGTVIAGCISTVVSVPTVMALLQSSRVEVGEMISTGTYQYAVENTSYENKLFMLFGSELGIALLIVFLVFIRKEWKKISHTVLMLGLMILPIFFELVNQKWHIAGYVEFPMRFGYMLPFTSIILLGQILEIAKDWMKEKSKNKLFEYLQLAAFAGIPFLAVILYYFAQAFLDMGIRDVGPYPAYWLIFWTMLCVFGFTFLARNNKVIPVVCALVIFMQCGLGWYGFLAPKYMFSMECTDSIVKNTEKVREVLVDDNRDDMTESISRIKDATMSLNTNFPMILGESSISGWTMGAKDTLRNFMWKQGYSSAYVRILDNGGTLFSDAMLNIDRIITFDKPEEALYRLTDEGNGYCISEYKYDYPFGIIVSDNMVNWRGSEECSALQYQNEIFQAMNQTDEEVLQIQHFEEVLVKEEFLEESGKYNYYFEVPMAEDGILYLQTLDENNTYNIYLNDKLFLIPILDFSFNAVYPQPFANGILDCGYYKEGEVVKLRLESYTPMTYGGLFGQLKLSVLQESMDEQAAVERVVETDKNSLRMEVQGKAGEYIMLPLSFDETYKVTVNGVEVQALSTLEDAFFLIPLQEGQNVIEMKFTPQGLVLGGLITLVGVLLLILFVKYNNKICSVKIMGSLAYILYTVCVAGFLLAIYVYPLIFTVYAKIDFYFLSK